MKTLNISVGLSSIAIETLSQALTPNEIISKVKNYLSEKSEVMGSFTGFELSSMRNFDNDLTLNEYQINYEKHSLQFEFLHFRPRDEWQVKGFRFVN